MDIDWTMRDTGDAWTIYYITRPKLRIYHENYGGCERAKPHAERLLAMLRNTIVSAI